MSHISPSLTPSARPSISVVFAVSMDGKIGDDRRSRARFGSSVDRRHLEQQVAQADGVLMGAGTLRSEGSAMGVYDAALIKARQQRGQAPQPTQIIASPSGDISPDLNFFNQKCPRWLLTLPDNVKKWESQPGFNQVQQFTVSSNGANGVKGVNGTSGSSTIDWPATLGRLKEEGIHHLAVLGGGTLVAALSEIGVIDEWHLTVCPLIIGGQHAPTPVDGEIGFMADVAPRFALKSADAVGHEVFLHYVRSN